MLFNNRSITHSKFHLMQSIHPNGISEEDPDVDEAEDSAEDSGEAMEEEPREAEDSGGRMEATMNTDKPLTQTTEISNVGTVENLDMSGVTASAATEAKELLPVTHPPKQLSKVQNRRPSLTDHSKATRSRETLPDSSLRRRTLS